MSKTAARTRTVPEAAEVREFADAGVVAYCYEYSAGPAVLAYEGSKLRATLNRWFPSTEGRDAALSAFVNARTAERNARNVRRSVPHGLAVGDVLSRTWGYEQTNVDFYEVVRVPSAMTVTVCRLTSRKVSSNPQGMTAKEMPNIGEYMPDCEAVTVRARGAGEVGSRASKTGYLSKWNGLPVDTSSYG